MVGPESMRRLILDKEIIAERLNTLPKLVFSNTLREAPWDCTTSHNGKCSRGAARP